MAKVNDGRIEKSQKKGRERKSSSFGLEKALEEHTNGDATTDSPCCEDKQEKKQVGIVIDGRTFTCATCKAGHRVGICKHGKERPMKPTHPPGRPSAGQPKKVICDCPRDCTCAKKDCKCPRRCNCTQSMFMLVYIPAPGMEDNPQDDSGSWKIGEEVTTDLKGNILSPQQIQERKKQKEAIKTESPGKALSRRDSFGPTQHTPLSPSQAKPVSSGGCCKHKQTVAKQNMVAMAAPTPEAIPPTLSKGCNCGSKCSCHFCPEHPNNSASINLARQQYLHFRNQQLTEGSNMIHFAPDLPLGASCMGGQPRFVMSTLSTRPSAAQLAQTFGTSDQYGYIIGYPVEQLRDTGNGSTSVTNDTNGLSTISSKPDGEAQQLLDASLPDQQLGHFGDSFGFSQDDFSIGDAFVASNGPDGWQGNVYTTESWPISPSATFASEQQFDFQSMNYDPSTFYSNSSHFQPQLQNSESSLIGHDQLHQSVTLEDHGVGYGQIGNGFKTYNGEYKTHTILQMPVHSFSPMSGGKDYG